MDYYLSNDIFSWEILPSWGLGYTHNEWLNSYNYHSHAEEILTHNIGDFYRSDAITNLKKSIEYRLKLIAKHQKIKILSKVFNKNGIIEILHHLGIIKPLMIKNIMKIRNSLEHQFSTLPPLDTCKELSEVTWYFLKSTDFLCQSPDVIELEHWEIENFFMSISISSKTHWKATEFFGWIPKNLYKQKTDNNTFKVNKGAVFTQNNFYLHCDGDVKKASKRWSEHGHGSDIIFVKGSISGKEAIKRLVELYFTYQ